MVVNIVGIKGGLTGILDLDKLKIEGVRDLFSKDMVF